MRKQKQSLFTRLGGDEISEKQERKLIYVFFPLGKVVLELRSCWQMKSDFSSCFLNHWSLCLRYPPHSSLMLFVQKKAI